MSLETYTTDYEELLEEDMPESQPQINLSDYLRSVLKQHYKLAKRFVTGNLAIFPPKDKTYPFRYIAPDIAIFPVELSEAEQAGLTSWRMSEPNRFAPLVVFEISSEETWKLDLDPKPQHYQLLGVKEYFAYDPQRYWQNSDIQLRGWRYSDSKIEEIQPDSQGRLWSVELDSWLEADGPYLRLYDPQGQLRLSAEEADQIEKEAAKEEARIAREAERAARQAERAARETARAAKQAERAAKQAARREIEAERAAKQAERAAKEAAQREIEAERAALQTLLEKLRKNNIDPDSL